MKTKILLSAFFLAFLAAPTLAHHKVPAHTETTSTKVNSVFNDLFFRYVNYPDHAKAEGVEATVLVSFYVDENGKMTQLNGLTNHGYGLEDEALRVIKTIGYKHSKILVQNGVQGYYQVPVTFQLL